MSNQRNSMSLLIYLKYGCVYAVIISVVRMLCGQINVKSVQITVLFVHLILLLQTRYCY